MSAEQYREEISAEALIEAAINVFGINISEADQFKGIPRYELKGKSRGAILKYRARYEHGPMGNQITTTAYPVEIEHARDSITTLVLSKHPLRPGVALFTEIRDGEEPTHLEGIKAQYRIAVFLAEAQADILAANS